MLHTVYTADHGYHSMTTETSVHNH